MRVLTVPALWRSDVLLRYQELNSRYEGVARIAEVYGSHPNSAFGSGRAAAALPRFSDGEFAQHVGEARRLGFSFSYLLNAACMGGIEGTYEGQRKIRRFLTCLVDVGVDKVTVTSPMLIQLVREYQPAVSIGVSVISYVDSVEKLLFFESIGARRVFLDIDATRNFPLIRAMRKATSIELGLIVNSNCRIGCPLKTYHYNVVAHLSQTGSFLDASGKATVDTVTPDYIGAHCLLQHHGDKVGVMKTALVRPEDLHYYSEAGIDIFKIQGRGAQPEALLRTIAMYMAGRTPLRHAPLSVFAAGIYGSTLDNAALDGFMAFFARNPYRCPEGCDNCRHCDQWAERAVSEDEAVVAEVKADSEKMMVGSLTLDRRVHQLAEALLSAAQGAAPASDGAAHG